MMVLERSSLTFCATHLKGLSRRCSMPFKNCWLIVGRLTTTTPLHLGNGEVITREDLVEDLDDTDALTRLVEISAVATDDRGSAYIPGKTLKGNLRSWLRRCGYLSLRRQRAVSFGLIDAIFGSEDPGANDAVGGKAEFWDAFSTGAPDPPPPVPYWDPRRLTGVTASVAIDRGTRTASPNKLFHEEFVPPGIGFDITITAQDLEPAELDLLLFALEGFNHPQDPVTMGADTSDMWGRLTWELRDIARLTKADVAAWLQRQPQPVAYGSLISLAAPDRERMVIRAMNSFQIAIRPCVSLNLFIQFDGPFLVNDPSQTAKWRKKVSGDDRIADHAPLRDYSGRVVLPARSIRGAIRSRAEKIVRTLKSNGACLAVDPEDACAVIYREEQKESVLYLTCQLFGAPGWRTCVEFSDFCPAAGSAETRLSQEFLAIDRFTGGGARGLKFNAEAVYCPTLIGTITIDLKRVEPWGLGLLALTLRDLMEGDIPLGFGAAKGYGACRATIKALRISGVDSFPDELQTIFKDNDALQISFDNLDTTARPPMEAECVVIELVKAFQTKVVSFARKHD